MSTFNSAILATSLALAAATDKVRPPRDLARLEPFEILEAPEGIGVPTQLIES